ncbi:LOW QUALITY PROTEIN: putative gap junction epsilon-1 protein [Chlamydotis macqueenii]
MSSCLHEPAQQQEFLGETQCPPKQACLGARKTPSGKLKLNLQEHVRLPTVTGQFYTVFFISVCMFFLSVLGFAAYENEALHLSCDPDKRKVNLFCCKQFRPITPQVFWTLQLVIVLAQSIFHLYAVCKSIKEDTLQKSFYSSFCIFSVFLRIILEAVAFWLQIQLSDFKVNAIYMCDVGALKKKKFNVVPGHSEKTIFLVAVTFTVITVVLKVCVAKVFEISCRRLGFLKTQ